MPMVGNGAHGYTERERYLLGGETMGDQPEDFQLPGGEAVVRVSPYLTAGFSYHRPAAQGSSISQTAAEMGHAGFYGGEIRIFGKHFVKTSWEPLQLVTHADILDHGDCAKPAIALKQPLHQGTHLYYILEIQQDHQQNIVDAIAIHVRLGAYVDDTDRLG